MARRSRASGTPYPQNELHAVNPRHRYAGERLAEVAFPLGGIGAGTVALGGCGELRDWEIFNRPNKRTPAGINFFALWAKPAGADPVVKMLETAPHPPYDEAHGFCYIRLAGIPHMDSLEFIGEYPIARVRFRDSALPVSVELEAFNPFLPLDPEDSGLPTAVFLFTMRNRTSRTVHLTLAANFTNLVGWDGSSEVTNRGHSSLGRNVTRFVRRNGSAGLLMTSRKYPPRSPLFGSMAVLTPWKRLTVLANWPRGIWWDPAHHWWNDFAPDGAFRNILRCSPSKDGRTDVSTLGLRAELKPGQSVTLPVVLAWHFPNRQPYPESKSTLNVKVLNHYSMRFADAWQAGEYVAGNLPRLHAATRDFHRTLFSSTYPAVVLDAASSQMSTIRSQTCFRTADGVFHAYEGCSPKSGCCPMNCTHVWNYEQTLAFLFPSLERTMRETDFLVNTRATGGMAFRTTLPLGRPLWEHRAAADGQMGCILKLYREWKLSGDLRWLRKLWPAAKRALEFAWREWDRDRDGVMERLQHNTYDIEFLGANSMMGTLYLAALRAGAELADALGQPKPAERYRRLADAGRKNLHRMLWNGEFYVQKYDPAKAPKYQFGGGCLSNQLLGQWFAMVVGLGHVLPPAHVQRTLRSIFRYNWRRDLRDHVNVQRVYALDDEAGLLLCTWPRGGRPAIPVPYSDEVWTGIEYQVAAHMIYEGLIEEGLTIVKGVRSRHDGARRNPWNEPECGDHYARAMASWSLLLALSGFDYSAPDARIRFAPKLKPWDFRTFFSTGGCWGTYSQKVGATRASATIRLNAGTLKLAVVELALPPQAHGVRVSAAGRTVRATLNSTRGIQRIVLASRADLAAGQTLKITLVSR